MAIRWKRYHSACKGKRAEGDNHGKVTQKGIDCKGRRGSHCPEGIPRDCGGWALEYRELDGRRVSKIFPGICKTEANELYEEMRSNVRRGMVGLPQIRKVPTLAEYAETYMGLNKTAKENTFMAKQRAVRVLIQYLGEYSLDKITAFIVEKFRMERKEKDGVKDSVINADTAILTHIFNTAVSAGLIGKNPCSQVRRLKVAQTKDRVLSQSEIALLLDKLQGEDRLMVLTGLLTGLRLGGVLDLTWQDIDFSKGLITSSHKTGRIVSIPMSDYLSGELLKHKETNPGDKVFGINTVVSKYSTYFSKLFKELGIHDFTFHGLRHTFSSLLQSDLGVGAVVVQGMTGHSSLGMLQKYSHTGLSNKQQAIQSLTDHVLNAKKETVLSVAQ